MGSSAAQTSFQQSHLQRSSSKHPGIQSGSLGTDSITFPTDYLIFAVISGLIYVFATRIGYTTEKVILFKESKESLAE